MAFTGVKGKVAGRWVEGPGRVHTEMVNTLQGIWEAVEPQVPSSFFLLEATRACQDLAGVPSSES